MSLARQFLSLLLFSSFSLGAIDGNTNSFPELYPCSQDAINMDVVKYNATVWTVVNNYTNCSGVDTKYPVLRVKTQTGFFADSRQPVVFVTRSDENIQTWKIAGNSTLNRTICSTIFRDRNTIEEDIAMYIDVFTSNIVSVSYNMTVEPVVGFNLSLNNLTRITVTTNSPQLYYFKFPHNHSNVRVTVSSEDENACLIVSVQNATCPVNDVLESARSKGVYQTMTTLASLTIVANQTIEKDDFFIVIVMADPSSCFNSPTSAQKSTRSVSISLEIVPSKFAYQYHFALVAPLFVLILIGTCATMTLCVPCCCYRPIRLFKHCSKNKLRPDTGTFTGSIGINTSTESAAGSSKSASSRSEAADDEKVCLLQTISSSESVTFSSDDFKKDTTDSTFLQSGINRELLNREDPIVLPHMLKTPIQVLEKDYSVYGWNTITVGIFYGLPAFQLLLAEQMILNSTGDQDTCYYNFNCSHPWGVLSAFNNVWSNIGYLVFGVFFIIIVGIRNLRNRRIRNGSRDEYETIDDDEVKVPLVKRKSYACFFMKRKKDHGVPQFYGIYYAMGVTLIMQGLMSSFYHICPNDSNFQFDTAFMYITGGLLMLAMFQARHPDIHTNAFVAFLSFAIIIVLTLIGIYESSSRYWSTRVVLLCLVMVAITVFSISFYFYHDWRLGYFIEFATCRKLREWLKTWSTYGKRPRSIVRFGKAILITVVNFIVGIAMIFSKKGVATIILAIFVANAFLLVLIYLLSKVWHREPWTICPFICLALIGVFWAVAFYFYFTNVAQWEYTPAVSRAENKDCVMLDFYDNHDVWHFVSSGALFFSFLFVLTLDDGLAETRTEEIRVF